MEKNISILKDLHKYNISVAANPSAETGNPDAPAQSNVPPAPPRRLSSRSFPSSFPKPFSGA